MHRVVLHQLNAMSALGHSANSCAPLVCGPITKVLFRIFAWSERRINACLSALIGESPGYEAKVKDAPRRKGRSYWLAILAVVVRPASIGLVSSLESRDCQ